jgi:prepilin-type N-terminal cleavage/methylation domain-containing protein
MVRRAARAFTLVELMIVVVLVGVLTVMAIPSMGEARYNARSMDDASEIAELFRQARSRAIGRGAAQLVSMSATANGAASTQTFPGGDLGTYALYEAQTTAQSDGGSLPILPAGSPLSSCGSPTTSWGGILAAGITIDNVNLNRAAENQAMIWSAINDGTSSPPTVPPGYLCYTPLGRTYYNSTSANFTPGVNLLIGELQISVYRSNVGGAATGLTRTVVIPNSGATRIVSQ